MNEGIWWLLLPGLIGSAVAMWCIYQVQAVCLFSHAVPIHQIRSLISRRGVFWQWRELLQTTLALGIAFALVRWPVAMALRHYFEPSSALYRHVWARQAAARR